MARLKVLICGAGIAGPALAFWLSRAGHEVVVVERFPGVRAGGAQIDLREQGIEAVRRMGLLDVLRSKLVDEAGMVVVDRQGKARATMMANTSGKGAQTFTSEYEIMRGDLVRILHDATKDKVRYLFRTTIEKFEQDDTGVTVTFSDGSKDKFDLLVGADGQGSRTRGMMRKDNSEDPYRHLGVLLAYYFIPRTEADNNLCHVYLSPGGRMSMRRSQENADTQVYMMLRHPSSEISAVAKSSPEKQREFCAQKYRGAGWETDRYLDGLETTKDFYCSEAVQVRIDRWHDGGRVVLLGDAAFCPSPFAGMGTTASLVGAYVLAGELLARDCEDLPGALAAYEKTMRPFVDSIQSVSTLALRIMLPDSAWAISIIHFFAMVLCWLRIPDIAAKFSSEEQGGWKLPNYAHLETRDT